MSWKGDYAKQLGQGESTGGGDTNAPAVTMERRPLPRTLRAKPPPEVHNQKTNPKEGRERKRGGNTVDGYGETP